MVDRKQFTVGKDIGADPGGRGAPGCSTFETGWQVHARHAHGLAAFRVPTIPAADRTGTTFSTSRRGGRWWSSPSARASRCSWSSGGTRTPGSATASGAWTTTWPRRSEATEVVKKITRSEKINLLGCAPAAWTLGVRARAPAAPSAMSRPGAATFVVTMLTGAKPNVVGGARDRPRRAPRWNRRAAKEEIVPVVRAAQPVRHAAAERPGCSTTWSADGSRARLPAPFDVLAWKRLPDPPPGRTAQLRDGVEQAVHGRGGTAAGSSVAWREDRPSARSAATATTSAVTPTTSPRGGPAR